MQRPASHRREAGLPGGEEGTPRDDRSQTFVTVRRIRLAGCVLTPRLRTNDSGSLATANRAANKTQSPTDRRAPLLHPHHLVTRHRIVTMDHGLEGSSYLHVPSGDDRQLEPTVPTVPSVAPWLYGQKSIEGICRSVGV